MRERKGGRINILEITLYIISAATTGEPTLFLL